MPFPRRIAGVLARHPGLTDSRTLTDTKLCAGAQFHSPTPLEVHEVVLDERTVYLCGTCRDNLRLFQEMLDAEGGELSWLVRREFGNQLRLLIDRRKTDG